MTTLTLKELLDNAITAREPLFDESHKTAFRLFNGFAEGYADLIIDLYAQTAVLYNYADPPEYAEKILETVQSFLPLRLPWIKTILLKTRHGQTQALKQGKLIYGETPDRRIREHGVRYAIDLTMHQDATFYLDTRQIRRWAIDNLLGKRVLNTFAYTGSLGVAACAGGASQVVHNDLNRQFLNVAKESYTLNGFPIQKKDFQAGDFWVHINRFKRAGLQFDCLFLDPPFFSDTKKGRVDLARNITRLINKVRPIIKHGGHLIVINNALFVSGQAFMADLKQVCNDGFVIFESCIPVPEDCTGYEHTRLTPPIIDPTPFNHATKIALLRVYHTTQ